MLPSILRRFARVPFKIHGVTLSRRFGNSSAKRFSDSAASRLNMTSSASPNVNDIVAVTVPITSQGNGTARKGSFFPIAHFFASLFHISTKIFEVVACVIRHINALEVTAVAAKFDILVLCDISVSDAQPGCLSSRISRRIGAGRKTRAQCPPM